jgi:hypothetical protein
MSVSGSDWEGSFRLLCSCSAKKKSNMRLAARASQSMFNQFVSNMTVEAIMTSSGKGQGGGRLSPDPINKKWAI